MTDATLPNAQLFADGALGITFRGHAMHFTAEQAAVILALGRRTAGAPSGANATQVGGDHYRAAAIQVWDAIEAWNLGFLDGNVVKYVARYRRKGGVEDLLKAKHYLDKLIERQRANSEAEAVEAAALG